MHEMCESWPNYPNDTFAGARFFISCLGVGSPAMVIEAKVASFQGGSFPVLILPPESHKVPFSQLPANNGWQPGCGPTDQINQWGVTQRPEKKNKRTSSINQQRLIETHETNGEPESFLKR